VRRISVPENFHKCEIVFNTRREISGSFRAAYMASKQEVERIKEYLAAWFNIIRRISLLYGPRRASAIFCMWIWESSPRVKDSRNASNINSGSVLPRNSS
jgi:hypothetical protein